jgi:ribosome-associated protein
MLAVMGTEEPRSQGGSLAGGIEVAPGRRAPADALGFEYVLGSGPGGQNVNKRATTCRLRVRVTDLPLSDAQRRRLRVRAGQRLTKEGELVIESGEHRTQNQNRRECMAKLRGLIIQSLSPPKKRIPTRPTRGSKERRLEAKKQRGQTKKMRKNPPSP